MYLNCFVSAQHTLINLYIDILPNRRERERVLHVLQMKFIKKDLAIAINIKTVMYKIV